MKTKLGAAAPRRLAALTAAAGLSVATLVAVGASLTPAQAASSPALGLASASPSDHLKDGDTVTVTLSGFPANATIAGVQCDEKILTTNDNTYCDTVHAAIFTADASGKATTTVTVRSGADFVSSNGQGVCDAQHDCVLAFQDYPGATTAAIATLSFGSATKTEAGPAAVNVKAGKAVNLNVTVTSTTSGTLTGTVTVKDGAKQIASADLSATGTAAFSLKLAAGTHKLTVHYSGDASYSASSDKVTVTVKKPVVKKKKR